MKWKYFKVAENDFSAVFIALVGLLRVDKRVRSTCIGWSTWYFHQSSASATATTAVAPVPLALLNVKCVAALQLLDWLPLLLLGSFHTQKVCSSVKSTSLRTWANQPCQHWSRIRKAKRAKNQDVTSSKKRAKERKKNVHSRFQSKEQGSQITPAINTMREQWGERNVKRVHGNLLLQFTHHAYSLTARHRVVFHQPVHGLVSHKHVVVRPKALLPRAHRHAL
jgi:hypothetical protein